MTTKLEKSRKTCVILYSRRHFDPKSSTPLENSSAGQIARSLYEELSKIEELEVHYFDAFDHTEWRRIKTDLLVSLIDNLELARWFFQPFETVVIAVNQHPLERLRLCSQAKSVGVPINALSASDGVFQPYRGLIGVNEILCVGNAITADTFRHFLKNCNITETFYSTYLGEQQSTKQVTKIENVLILMSSIGYRKGFDRIYDSFMTDGSKLGQYQFHIIGQPEGPFWEEKINEITEKFSNVHFHGWISNNSDQFNSVLNRMDVSLFPTREEGLVGSLLECINSGVLSLHTSNSGLNHNSNAFKISDFGDIQLSEKLSYISALGPEMLASLQGEQFIQMQSQMSSSPNIALALRALVTGGISKKKSRQRKLRTLMTFIHFPIFPLFPIVLRRVNLTFVRVLKAKVSITYPGFYETIKKLKNGTKHDAM